MDEGFMEFLHLLGRLKHLPRTGWVLCGVEKPETVASHMYRMAMLTFNIADDAADRTRCMKMALVHDLAESVVGDITPFCNVSKQEKAERERRAMQHIADLVPGAGDEFIELFNEYEQGSSLEARLVHDLDKFDMLLQAYEYEKETDRAGQLQQFFDTAQDAFTTDTVQSWVQTLLQKRNTFLNDSVAL